MNLLMKRLHSRVLRYSLGALSGFIVAMLSYTAIPRHDPVVETKPVKQDEAVGQLVPSVKSTPVRDDALFRRNAWASIVPKLKTIKAEMSQEADRSAISVEELFERGRGGARAFAAEAISIRGKFAYLQGQLDPGTHEKYLEACFAKNVFRPDELKKPKPRPFPI